MASSGAEEKERKKERERMMVAGVVGMACMRCCWSAG